MQCLYNVAENMDHKLYNVDAHQLMHHNSKTYFSFVNSQVRTLFVSGLPMDAKPRELYLLFRAYDGYEGSLLKVTSKNGKTASVRNN